MYVVSEQFLQLSSDDRKTVSDILRRTDFERVRAYMSVVGWTYGGERKTPSIYDLVCTAQEALVSLITKMDDNAVQVEVGGFKAIVEKVPDESGAIQKIVNLDFDFDYIPSSDDDTDDEALDCNYEIPTCDSCGREL